MGEFRLAWRLLCRTPGFTAAAVVTLAVGIGATTAIFTMIDAVLLRPLDLPEADRVMVLTQASPYGTAEAFRYSEFLSWTSSGGNAGIFSIEAKNTVTVESADGVSSRDAAFVGAGYFDVLQQPPVRGRGFAPADDQTGAAPVVIIGHGYWQTMLRGDEGVVGSVLRIAGVPFTVIGVAAPGIRGTVLRAPIELFLPAHAILRTTTLGPGTGNYYFEDGSPGWSPSASWRVVVRLRPGISREQLVARLPGDRVEAVPVQIAAVGARVRGDVSRFSTMLFIAVLLVLAIGCANIAGLMMARTEARRRDIAVRLALGISRARLARQLMIDCLLIAAAGATSGFVMARWLLAGLSSFEVAGFVKLADMHYRLDVRVLAFSIGLGALAALAFAVAPMRMAATTDVLVALKNAPGSGGRARLRHLLIFGQVAITVVLLLGAGLFIRSLRAALAVDIGVETGRVIVADADVRSARYSASQQDAYYASAVQRLATIPGVRSVSWGTGPFIFAGNSTPVVMVDGVSVRLPKNVAEFQGGPDYFRTLGIRLLRGRDFTAADAPGAPPVVVVNAAFAQRFWPHADPIGRRITMTPYVKDASVVGIAEDGKYSSLTESGRLAMFAPWRQTAQFAFAEPWWCGAMRQPRRSCPRSVESSRRWTGPSSWAT